MYSFGQTSRMRLATCHGDLQKIANELIKEMDVSIICGHRTEYDQNKAFNNGNSKLKYPFSKHNKYPSHAMDVVPYPISWTDLERFEDMCDRIERIAKELGIKVRMGRDFSFKDYPHVELV